MEMRKAIRRLTRVFSHAPIAEVTGPTPIVEELAAMGAVDAESPPLYLNPVRHPFDVSTAEIVKAKVYARYGHLAYVNTSK